MSSQAVSEARTRARVVCDEQGLDEDRRDAVLLVVSELMGNAVRHGRPPVSCTVIADGADVIVSVDDADPTPLVAPRRRTVDDQDEGGRGLRIVAGLARLWGSATTSKGKRVWARV
jgi:anti-sigma regulatory factor (Ser/Thr protein kinase)